MKKLRVILIVGAAVVMAAAFTGYKMLNSKGFDTGHPLRVNAAVNGRIALVDDDLSTESLPAGWVHRTFWNVTPTQYTLTDIDGRKALHCATDNSGSILVRDVSIPLADFPILTWEWIINTPLVSDIDEETHEGDDHPARFFVIFKSSDETAFAAEIIWSNTRFAPGDYKIIDGFYHLVANGLNENIGVWHEQSVDLQALYQKISGANDEAEISALGFFCDSDNTGGTTSAHFSNVHLESTPPNNGE